MRGAFSCFVLKFRLQRSRNVCPDATARPWHPRMGLDDSEHVRPDTVSPTLRCPICTDVLLEARSHVTFVKGKIKQAHLVGEDPHIVRSNDPSLTLI